MTNPLAWKTKVSYEKCCFNFQTYLKIHWGALAYQVTRLILEIVHRLSSALDAHRDEVDKQVKEMLAQGVIEPSMSPWLSPIVLVRKKDREFRLCID